MRLWTLDRNYMNGLGTDDAAYKLLMRTAKERGLLDGRPATVV